MIAQLTQMNVPYKVTPTAAARSWCRRRRCTTLRLKLATAGLPKGSVVGLRADGQRPLRPDPVPGAPDLPARPRRRADPLDQVARRGADRARAPGAAEPERLLPRAAEAERLGAADACTRAARSTARRSPASCTWSPSSVPELDPKAVSVLDQSGALLSRSGDAPPERRASTRSSCSTSTRSRAATPSASSSCSSRSSAATTCARPSPPRSTSRRPRRPPRNSSRTRAPTPASRSAASRPPSSRAARGALPSGVPGAASNQPPIAGHRAARRRRPAAAGRAAAPAAAPAAGARR